MENKIFYQFNTKNVSFLEVHYNLKSLGIENNKFFLLLLDPDLANIDPRDPNLNQHYKLKVLKECMSNYWYFLREVLRIPDQGGSANGGVPYKLHRGNLAYNFCSMYNWNIFQELPRQHGKTIGVCCRLLWVYLFGTTNSEVMIINKKHDDSKLNLQRIKDIRDTLPSYLQMSSTYGMDGKKLKAKSNVETLEHPTNKNKLKTLPAARNAVLANGLGRGCSQPIQWYDEYAFIPYNNIIYLSATPAFKNASQNAMRNKAPYGIIITTTPGDLNTDEGMDAYMMKEMASKFTEKWYDMTHEQLHEMIRKNTDSNFVYIKFSYKQLGSGEEYFRGMVIDLKKDWSAIRREVLLEWAKVSDNSPFKKEDLDLVSTLVRDPIDTIQLCTYYTFNLYQNLNLQYPPLIGVDVSGGFRRDSSAITIIDSHTTEVVADFNCNYISVNDLARVIYELVTKYMSNAIINIERNGGYGASVISQLVETKIKGNLYFEIKDRVNEERFVGAKTIKSTQKTKVFGLDSTKKTRELMMELLSERMEHHKDKFISSILYHELETLEVKKNGRIEHSSNGHDDQVFAYLLALYVWYYGVNVMENWGLRKNTLKTDKDIDEGIMRIEEKYDSVLEDISNSVEVDNMIQEQFEYISKNVGISYEAWMKQEHDRDMQAMQNLIQTPLGKKAYAEKFKINEKDIHSDGMYTISDSVFKGFYE